MPVSSCLPVSVYFWQVVNPDEPPPKADSRGRVRLFSLVLSRAWGNGSL